MNIQNLSILYSHPSYKMVIVSIISLISYIFLLSLIKTFFPKRTIPYSFLLLGFSILPIVSVLRKGSYESGDLNIHISRTMDFYNSLSQGITIPRWAADLNATYGYALFNFYYPLPYYISSIYHFLGFSFLNSIKLLLITTYISSGLFMFLWLKRHLPEKSAFLGSIFYLFAPYHFVDMHYRASVGEMTAFTFLPLSFLLVDKVIKENNFIKFFLAGMSCALLILSHPAISILGYGFLTIYILFFYSDISFIKKSKAFIPLILGILYSAFYWIPVIFEGKYVHQKIGELVLSFPTLAELLYSKWRYGLLFQGPQGELTYLIGYAHLMIVILAIYLFLKKKSNWKINFFTLSFFIFFFLIQKISLPVWNNIPILKKMLLPYRILAIIVFIISTLSAFVAEKMNSNILIYIITTIAIGTTIINWGNRKNTPQIKDDQIRSNLYFITAQEEGAWNAVSITRPPDQLWQNKLPKENIESLGNDLKIIAKERKATKHSYLVNVYKSGLVKENTYYFPGWELKIDSIINNIIYNNKLYPGIITFYLNKGLHRIDLYFKDTPLRQYANLTSAFSLLTSGMFLLFDSKFSKFNRKS